MESAGARSGAGGGSPSSVPGWVVGRLEPMIPDLTGMNVLKQKFPSAGIVVFGDDDLQNNLAYVTNGARDYVTRTMLVLPQVEMYLKKRMTSDWLVRQICAN
jgi:hypothetical protein